MESISNKSQILKLCLIIALLMLTPLFPNSLRPMYLYFLFNLLIITLGAEAGLLSFFLKTAQEIKSSPPASFLTPTIPLAATNEDFTSNNSTSIENIVVIRSSKCDLKLVTSVIEKCSSAKIVGAVNVHVVKCPSTPSLFFIGDSDHGENEDMATEELAAMSTELEYDIEEEELPSGQELFHKAETFIDNFYKQLKMQREDSWKKIHGLPLNAF